MPCAGGLTGNSFRRGSWRYLAIRLNSAGIPVDGILMKASGSSSASRDDQPRLFVSDPEERQIFALVDAHGRVMQVSGRTRELLGSEGHGTEGMSALGNV